MKKIYIALVLSILLSTPSSLFAHTIGISGDYIAAVMHISPNDQPKAGVLSTIYFEFRNTSSSNKFTLSNCTCTFTVKTATTTLLTKALDASNIENNTTAKVLYLFAKPQVYHLEISGTPKDKKSFTAFTISYDIDVTSTGSNSYSEFDMPMQHSSQTFSLTNYLLHHAFHIILFGAAFIVILFIIFKDGKAKK